LTTPPQVDTSASPHTAFFTEHDPAEFEASSNHYLKDIEGSDTEPAAELAAAAAPVNKPWGDAIGAALVVSAVTFSGVFLLVPAVTSAAKHLGAAFAALVAAFAAGALLSCAFNLLLFESTHLIAVEHREEKEAAWRWGAMILSGFLVSTVVDSVISFFAEPQPPAGKAAAQPELPAALQLPTAQQSESPEACAGLEAGDMTELKPAERASRRERARLIGGVLIGDFFHNLCDGVFIGAAFSKCSPAFGWSVVSGTVIHEVAQELSDFTILTSPGQGGLSVVVALALNFISGLSVVIGVLAVLGSGVTDATAGLILAFGGGVYIHVGAAECMPRVYRLQVTPWQPIPPAPNPHAFASRSSRLRLDSDPCCLTVRHVYAHRSHCGGGRGGSLTLIPRHPSHSATLTPHPCARAGVSPCAPPLPGGLCARRGGHRPGPHRPRALRAFGRRRPCRPRPRPRPLTRTGAGTGSRAGAARGAVRRRRPRGEARAPPDSDALRVGGLQPRCCARQALRMISEGLG
jgi:zinc transporter ZupT